MLNNNKSVNPEVLDTVFETLNPSYAVLEARQTNKSTPNQIKPHLEEEFYIHSTADNSDTIFLRLHFPLFDARKIISAKALEKSNCHPTEQLDGSWWGVSVGSTGRQCLYFKARI